MRLIHAISEQPRINLRAWRGGWLLFLLMLCSCRGVPQGQTPNPLRAIPVPPTEATLQNRAVTASVAQAVESVAHVPIEQVVDQGLPIPVTTVSPWTPPGIAGPWPHDEYLQDGGDRDVQANIGPEGEVRGLELEDTVVVYDTVNGRTLIEPSNRVCLYAPRFAAVRKVTSVLESEQREQLVGVKLPVKAVFHQEDRLATTAVQPIQPEGEIATRQLSVSRVGEGAIGAISRQPIAAMAGGFALHENFKVIRQGTFEESEKARLMEMVDAAITWTNDKAVQVVLNGTQAVAVTSDQRVQATYRVDEPDHPCLRVIKVASTKTAKPGDIVDFTIRFDNLGDQVINQVALIDNLTTRLEYVQGSAQSSRESDFSTERNEGDSLVLRWDFVEPLEVGGGGLVRFHCRVR